MFEPPSFSLNPINTIIVAICESWATTKESIRKLEVFHMRCLRSILNIKWSDVIDEKIPNLSVWKKINNTRNIESLIAKRKTNLPR